MLAISASRPNKAAYFGMPPIGVKSSPFSPCRLCSDPKSAIARSQMSCTPGFDDSSLTQELSQLLDDTLAGLCSIIRPSSPYQGSIVSPRKLDEISMLMISGLRGGKMSLARSDAPSSPRSQGAATRIRVA